MKESYGEGLANHTSLESCGNCSNAMAEASTEGSAGGLLSSEITNFRVPTTWSGWEGNTCCSVKKRGTFVRNVHNDWQQMFLNNYACSARTPPLFVPPFQRHDQCIPRW
jgi:hypothetical protein